jgi:hypothetical protein
MHKDVLWERVKCLQAVDHLLLNYQASMELVSFRSCLLQQLGSAHPSFPTSMWVIPYVPACFCLCHCSLSTCDISSDRRNHQTSSPVKKVTRPVPEILDDVLLFIDIESQVKAHVCHMCSEQGWNETHLNVWWNEDPYANAN